MPEQKISEKKKEPVKEPETIKEVPEQTNEIPEKSEIIREEKVIEPALTSEQEKRKLAEIQNKNIRQAQNATAGKVTVQKKTKRKTDFEKFIGENLLVKIAVTILVLGMIFLVKWAIDNEWINEVARIGIGVATGGLLIGLGHASRKKYTAFASVLAGGGLAILYASVSLGYQLYQLFPQTVAFVILVIITIFSVMLSLGYDKKSLAVFALVGGFASPILVSDGGGNYMVLFSYIIILDLGMLVLGYFKKWHIVNISALVLTFAIFGGWLGSTWYDTNMPYADAMIFATIFYFIFFGMFLMHNVISKQKFTVLDFSLLLTTTFMYYAAGMFILEEILPTYKGIFTASIAVFNLLVTYPLYKTGKIDKRLIFLLIAVVLTFLSLTAPVQLNGQYITIFWAIESVALLWLSQKTGIKLMRIFSMLVVVLAAGSLFMDWETIYFNIYLGGTSEHMDIIFNKGFITSISVVASFIINSWLLKHDEKIKFIHKINPQGYKTFIGLIILVFMYFAISLELTYHLNYYFERRDEPVALFYSVFHYLYILGMMIWVLKKHQKVMAIIMLALSYISIIVYMSFFNYSYGELVDDYLNKIVENSYMLYRLLATVFVALTAFATWFMFKKILDKKHIVTRMSLWLTIFITVFVFSVDITNFMLVSEYSEFAKFTGESYISGFYELHSSITQSAHRIAWPVLWGVSSFLLIILGLKLNIKDFRFIALALFFVTIVKLFAWDVWYMSQGGRVVAFISLGVLLLIVAFVYQKLKVLLFEKEEKENEQEAGIEENIQ